MRPHSILVSLVLAFVFVAFFSCKDDEISTNPNHQLAFSSDTIFFDTIFAEISSVTGSFRFYNRNNKPLEISKIELLGGENSYFRLNIPNAGEQANNPTIYDVFIRAKDSLFVFVALTPPDLDSDTPQKIEDDLVFYVNGNRQVVKLLAYSQSVVCPDAAVGSYVFTEKRPYLIKNEMQISGDATFNAGARVFMRDKVNLVIGGNLTIDGTQEKPVVIRGDRLDYMTQKLPYDFLPGQWGSIKLTATGATHNINHAFIRNGQTGLNIEGENITLNIKNSWIHNFDDYGIIARNSVVNVANSQITNCGISCVDIAGGESEFTFVTFGNYYRTFRPSATNRSRTTSSVVISNYINDESGEIKNPMPVNNANFINCLIFGNYNPELTLNEMEDVPFNYSFSHCLIRKKEIENDRFDNIVWLERDENKIFVSITDTLNFRLKEDSPAINKGTKDFTNWNLFSLDFDGNSRYTDDAPDIGAFEFVPQINE